jgi:hypothetical protein
MMMILTENKAYDFSKGNLTIEYIERHIMNKDFIERAQNSDDKKD